MSAAAEDANQRLVDQMIARGALWSRPLIEAFRTTPRHCFLDRVYHYQRQHGWWREIRTRSPGRNELRLLYSDRALTTRLSEAAPGQPAVPISSSSQPSLMAEMLEDLRLSPGLRVLEIGAGTGYNAALLAKTAGRVVSLDIDPRVLAEAREHLRAFPDRPVEFHQADGRLGWAVEAPYDRILVTAATPDLEPAWLEQLAEGGLLMAPLDLAPGLAYLVRGTCRQGIFEGRLVRPAYFMPLRSEEGENCGPDLPALPAADPLPSMIAPWADWAERKAPVAGPGALLPSLAFLGWLHGYAIGYQALADGRTLYGVGDAVQGHACWFGMREWRISGSAGRDLGVRLWRDFLDAGGPWPTEFQLRTAVGDAAMAEEDGEVMFPRQGANCRQVWALKANRERPPLFV
jgi:protein-L-isoaspartate(D-aspartate) O-methyltransferase